MKLSFLNFFKLRWSKQFNETLIPILFKNLLFWFGFDSDLDIELKENRWEGNLEEYGGVG